MSRPSSWASACSFRRARACWNWRMCERPLAISMPRDSSIPGSTPIRAWTSLAGARAGFGQCGRQAEALAHRDLQRASGAPRRAGRRDAPPLRYRPAIRPRARFRTSPSRGTAARSPRAINSSRHGFGARGSQPSRRIRSSEAESLGQIPPQHEPPVLLLLASKLGYQTRSFAEAARRLGVEVIIGSDRCHQLDDPWADGAIPLHFEEPQEAAERLAEAVRARAAKKAAERFWRWAIARP